MGIAALAIGSRETLDATKRKPTSACGTFMVHSYVIAYVACTELGRFVSTRSCAIPMFRCARRGVRAKPTALRSRRPRTSSRTRLSGMRMRAAAPRAGPGGMGRSAPAGARASEGADAVTPNPVPAPRRGVQPAGPRPARVACGRCTAPLSRSRYPASTIPIRYRLRHAAGRSDGWKIKMETSETSSLFRSKSNLARGARSQRPWPSTSA